MYTLCKNGKYLYKTYRGDFIFSDKPNMIFATEDQATNWLYYNFNRFDSEGCFVTLYVKDMFTLADPDGFKDPICVKEYHGLVKGDNNGN